MPTDYPDGFRRNLPGHTVDMETGFSLPWCESTSLVIAAAGNSSFTVEFSSLDWIYFVDMINVTPQAYTEFYISVAVNGVLYTAGANMGFIIIPLRTNPSINFINGDSVAVTVTNKDASSRTFKVMINGSKILRPSTYGKVPGALFSFTPAIGCSPLSVVFTDESVYDPTSWEWKSNGVDVDSTEQNPTIVLSVPGIYSPVLKATNQHGSDTYSSANSLRVAKTLPLASYTLVDPNGRFSGLSYPLTITNMICNENAYIYYDYGANFFDAYDILTEAKITGGDATGQLTCVCLSTKVPPVVAGSGYNIVVNLFKNSSSSYQILFKLQNNASDVVIDTMSASVNTIYYMRLVHVAGSTTATLYVYSDATYTTLVDTLVITNAAVATKFRYLNATASHNQGTTYKASGVIYQTGVLSPTI